MPEEIRIALVMNKEVAYWREMLRGVLQFAHLQPDWTLHSVPRLDERGLNLLRRWRPAGVIAEVASPAIEAELASLGVPVVAVSNTFASNRFPRVGVDDEQVGVAIAEHLLARGFRELASVCPDTEATRIRRAGFENAIRQAGVTARIHAQPQLFTIELTDGWSSLDRILGVWLKSLPRPLGVMLDDDDLGMWITQACQKAGLVIPDQVSVVGVNDDSLNCEMCNPNLSSLGIPKRAIGNAAAAMMQQLLAGNEVPERVTLLPPLAITERHSSNILAVDDPDVAAAVKFIDTASARPLSVEDVLSVVSVSRRILERKFRAVLGRTPLQEIQRRHIDRAKRLLSHTDLQLDLVAEQSGFGNVHHLCRLFRRETSQTPMQFRRECRVTD